MYHDLLGLAGAQFLLFRSSETGGTADKVAEAALKAKPGADLGAEPFPGGSGTVEETAPRSSASSVKTSPCAAGTAWRLTVPASCTPTCTWAAKSACSSPCARARTPPRRRPPSTSSPTTARCKSPPWAKKVCLLKQASVSDAEKTVETLRAGLAKEVGADFTLSRFVRFERGEGIEKPTTPDFAEEVAKMAGGG